MPTTPSRGEAESPAVPVTAASSPNQCPAGEPSPTLERRTLEIGRDIFARARASPGPGLAVVHAADFEQAIQIANDTDYALTGGVYSRGPADLQRARWANREERRPEQCKSRGDAEGAEKTGGNKVH